MPRTWNGFDKDQGTIFLDFVVEAIQEEVKTDRKKQLEIIFPKFKFSPTKSVFQKQREEKKQKFSSQFETKNFCNGNFIKRRPLKFIPRIFNKII